MLFRSSFEEVIAEHLDPRRPEPEREDLVDVLLRVQKDPNQAITLNSDQIKGVLTVCFLFLCLCILLFSFKPITLYTFTSLKSHIK